jgi:hypothetical protein
MLQLTRLLLPPSPSSTRTYNAKAKKKTKKKDKKKESPIKWKYLAYDQTSTTANDEKVEDLLPKVVKLLYDKIDKDKLTSENHDMVM